METPILNLLWKKSNVYSQVTVWTDVPDFHMSVSHNICTQIGWGYWFFEFCHPLVDNRLLWISFQVKLPVGESDSLNSLGGIYWFHRYLYHLCSTFLVLTSSQYEEIDNFPDWVCVQIKESSVSLSCLARRESTTWLGMSGRKACSLLLSQSLLSLWWNDLLEWYVKDELHSSSTSRRISLSSQ